MTQPKYDESRVARMRASLQDSSITDLVDAAAMARYEFETAKRIDALFSDALYQRRAEGQSVIDGADSIAELSEGQTYEWNGEGLTTFLHAMGFDPVGDGLVEYVPPTEQTWKVNTVKTLAWARKRAKNLSPFYETKPTAPRWSYSDKKGKNE